ncbi:MAG TPA: helix-turn-helix transcriptional regulator [Elusimicrobiota bacterium]|nr:helix-turn-helix transcriptional regulator [Elusimicrobiota bacterium]
MAKTPAHLAIKNRLNVLRAERRITQEQLAKEVGVTRATIIAIEGEDYNPSLELAFRLARYFDTDVQSLFFIKEGTK